jgi:hypothetical protein
LDIGNALKSDINKAFVGCRLLDMVINSIAYAKKKRFIVDPLNQDGKGIIMGIICRGWDVGDLEFIRACSQRKASCSTTG